MARARGSYPRCHWFKSSCRYHHKKRTPVRSHINGPVVKRLRLRPFTAATRVRVPSGSPPFFIWRHSSAGRALASHARGHRFEFCCLHQKSPSKPFGLAVISFVQLLGGFLGQVYWIANVVFFARLGGQEPWKPLMP